MNKIFIDVGAHIGSSSIHFARQNSTNIVYAFEPVPILINAISEQITELPNYHIIGKAVSINDGKAFFNVREFGDWGQGSLLTFNDQANIIWPGIDLRFTDKIEVDTIRLDTFINQNDIEHISHLHIDAQGYDLQVLASLGKYLNADFVSDGVIEASYEGRVSYNNGHTYQEALDFLKNAGFEITHTENNDMLNNEVNIFFKGSS